MKRIKAKTVHTVKTVKQSAVVVKRRATIRAHR